MWRHQYEPYWNFAFTSTPPLQWRCGCHANALAWGKHFTPSGKCTAFVLEIIYGQGTSSRTYYQRHWKNLKESTYTPKEECKAAILKVKYGKGTSSRIYYHRHTAILRSREKTYLLHRLMYSTVSEVERWRHQRSDVVTDFINKARLYRSGVINPKWLLDAILVVLMVNTFHTTSTWGWNKETESKRLPPLFI